MSAPEKPAPPVVGKVKPNSIELSWNQASTEDTSGGRLCYCVQEEEDVGRKGFGNVYNAMTATATFYWYPTLASNSALCFQFSDTLVCSEGCQQETGYLLPIININLISPSSGFAKSNVFKGLDENKTYRYRLRISNDHGHSPWSQVITVTTTKIPLCGYDLHRAVLNWEVENVKAILEESIEKLDVDSPNAFGMSPLMIAAQKGYTSIVSLLIEHKANVNYSNTSGKNSMMMACFAGHLKVAQLLFEHGASIDTWDKGGSCCIHWAVDGEKTGCIQWLLDNGINVDVEDDSGCSPLIRLASMNGSVDVARILVENGADVNKVDKIKKSSLMVAALNGNLALVQLLVENGANLHAENEYGKTAVDFAESFGRKEVASYLTSLLQRSSAAVEGEKDPTKPEDAEMSDS